MALCHVDESCKAERVKLPREVMGEFGPGKMESSASASRMRADARFMSLAFF